MKVIITLLVTLPFQVCISQDLPPKQPSPLDVKQIHSGHSLTDPLFNNWPGQYVNLIGTINDEPGWELFNSMVGKSTIPGSSIRYRWDNAVSPNAKTDIGDWELLVITERVALMYEGANSEQWYVDALEEQRQNLSLFVNNAWNNGNDGQGAPSLLWTTWVNIDGSDGDFRQMLDVQESEWELMQDYANQNRPSGSPPVYIIPGHRMMARLHDDILLGEVPGINNIGQFFSDNIHLNYLGEYAVSLIHYASIFNRSPLGLSTNLHSNPPEDAQIPSPELAAYLQSMIWEVVTNYPRTGINAIVPVQLVNFTANPLDRNLVELKWETASEINNDFFTVQRSSDRVHWETVATKKGAANSNISLTYKAYDRSPLPGKSYYRLKQTDFDGHFDFSEVSVVDLKKWKNDQVQLYPNPTSSDLTIEGNIEDFGDLTIYNSLGQKIKATVRSNKIDESRMTLDLSNLIQGHYYLLTKSAAYKIFKQ